MALDPSIALQVQQPNLANTMGSFLDLGAKKLAFDRARATYDADVAQRLAESSSAQSKATVDAANVQPLIDQQKAFTGQQQIAEKQAQFTFDKAKGETILGTIGGLIQNPAVVNGDSVGSLKALMSAEDAAVAKGIPREAARAVFSRYYTIADDNPQALRQSLADLMQGNVPAQTQASQNLVPAISQQQTGGTDVRGNPTVISRDQFGNIKQATLPQLQISPTQPQPLTYPVGESPSTYKLLSDEREAARSTITQAPTIHALNSEILRELKLATTGQYSGVIAKGQSLAGMLGLSLDGSTDAERLASAYDLIDKYTTQAATRAAQSMGNDTATALNAQLKQNASVERNPTAIKKSIKFNDAVLSGAEAYQSGLERAIQANPQMDVFSKRRFDQEWARNFDPVVFQIYNAKKSGDTEELADILKALGPRAPEVVKKAQRLQELAQRGF